MLNKEESVLVQPCLVLCALLCFVAAPPPPPPQPDTCAAAAAAAAAVLSPPSPFHSFPGVAPGRVWRALPPTALVLAPDRFHPLGSVECLNHCLCWAYRRWDCALLGGRFSWPNCLPTNSLVSFPPVLGIALGCTLLC